MQINKTMVSEPKNKKEQAATLSPLLPDYGVSIS